MSLTPPSANQLIRSFQRGRTIPASFVAFGGLLFACSGGPDSGTAPDPDTNAPVVSLTSPASGTLQGTVELAADATDDRGVVGVRFRVDGLAIGNEDTSAPYSVEWVTTASIDGPHTVVAIARDAAGNLGTSANVPITLANAPVPGPLVVRIVTSGVHLDPDGYSLVVDGAPPIPVSPQETLEFDPVSPGVHQLALSGLQNNCGTTNPFPVNVAGPDTTRATLGVLCRPDELIFETHNRFQRIYEDGVPLADLPLPPALLSPTKLLRWAKDGQSVLFDIQWQVAGMHLDGTNYRVLSTEPGAGLAADWSREGARLLYTAGSATDRGQAIVSVLPNFTGRQVITPDTIGANWGTYSPDGSQVVFEGAAAHDIDFELYRINANGAGITRLTDNNDTDARAAWSPDGNHIAFMTARQGVGITRIFLMNPDGSNQVQITPDTLFADYPAWSPDGLRIAFVGHNANLDAGLFLINPDGTDLKRIFVGTVGIPSWRPR